MVNNRVRYKTIEYGSNNWEESVALREKVLRSHYENKLDSDELETEKNHIHIAGFIDDKLVSTAVLVPEGKSLKMQRVAVEPGLRNNSIGSSMLDYCHSIATEMGYERVYCHARDSAVKFYKKNSYLSYGDYFLEDDIPHLKMEIFL